MIFSQELQTYRFWDVVSQWAQEQFLHEHLVARAVARGVVRDGLRLQSLVARCSDSGKSELQGEPLVSYVARHGGLPIFIRGCALAHLISAAQGAAVPERQMLQHEFIAKQDFLSWLDEREFPLPQFWLALEASRPHPARVGSAMVGR